MGDEGVTAVEEGVCPRDGVATRLRCTDCQTPICPSCFVRTPVGLKCQTCGAPGPGAVAGSGRREPARLAIGAVVAVVIVAAGAWAVLGRSGGGGLATDADVGATPRSTTVQGATPRTTTVQGAVAGTGGRALDGKTWTLEARRDDQGRICYRLRLNNGSGPGENCDTPPGTRPFGPVRAGGAFGLGGPSFQSWGVISDRVSAVRATADDGTTTDAEVFGGELGLGVKFFMSYVDRVRPVTFFAYGPGGEELGRVDPPPISPPPRAPPTSTAP